MSLLVVGSIAFDTIQTESEIRHNLLGGSASYFSFAASLYTPVNLVGVVGKDFPQEFIDHYHNKGVDTQGLQIKEGETFRWWGKYSRDMNHRETIETKLNVFGTFDPIIPESYQSTPYVFLGNGLPSLQSKVLDQMTTPPKFVALDTMNLWIDTQRPALLDVLKRVNALFLNDEEARMLTGHNNLIQAGRKIMELGPEIVIVKKGEHGALVVSGEGLFITPAFPLESFSDPTGAGDSFGGGFMGFVAREDNTSFDTVKKAVLHGTVVASFTCEAFGTSPLENLKYETIEKRMDQFIQLAYVC